MSGYKRGNKFVNNAQKSQLNTIKTVPIEKKNEIKQNSSKEQNSFSNDINKNKITNSEQYPITSENKLFIDLNCPPTCNINLYSNFSEIKPVGLINFNFSCYMNSCLQCFYHCKLFINEILKEKDNIKKYKNSPIANALIDLIEDMNSIGKNISLKNNNYPARNFYDTLIKKYPKFKYIYGNDPKAVSSLILLFMPQELQPTFSYRIDKKFNKSDEESLFKDIYHNYNKNLYFLADNFYYCVKIKKICKDCKKKKLFTYSFIYYYMHDFYISQICNKLKKNNPELHNQNILTCSLIDCFNDFKEPDDENSVEFMCYNCRKKVTAIRVLYFMATLPNYLVICINDEGKLAQNYKLIIDLEIDLEDFFMPPKNYVGSKETKYEFHCGVFIRGDKTHAIAICKHFDNKYYEFDDKYYKEVNDIQKKLRNEIPYLMFYKRKDIPV